jgi:hypothetical protein
MRSRLECLLSAIAAYNKANIPGDPAYNANNPLRLQVFENGKPTFRLRQFGSIHSGQKACLFDLEMKCNGASRADLGDHTVTSLMRTYSIHQGTEEYIVKYLHKAIGDPKINTKTKLDYFVEAKNARPAD